MTRINSQARKALDARLAELHDLAQARPHKGWIRAIRDGLAMSSAELAHRMGVTQQAVFNIERSEARGTIKLETLSHAADALGCDLVYVLRPRSTLDRAVRAQARRKAAEHLSRIAHQSRLEDQSVSDAETAAQLDDLAAQFIDRRGLWAEADSTP